MNVDIETPALTDEQATNELLAQVFESNNFRLEELVERCRGLAPNNVYLAAVFADSDALHALLDGSPHLANTAGGPRQCEPLVYLCHSPLQVLNSSFPARQFEAAAYLLSLGADANAHAVQEGHETGVSALYGTCRPPGSPEVCKLLLENGARVSDGESLYHACELEDLSCLALLLDYNPDERDREYCVGRMIDHDNPAGLELFLQHGTNPNRLCGALFRERSIECIQILLKNGADVNEVCGEDWLKKRVAGLTPIRIAERNAPPPDIVDLLRSAGAQDLRSPVDYLIGACVRDDAALIARLLTEQPTLCDTLNENDHSFLSSIARTGNFRAVERMLDLGFRIDATADDIFAPAFIYAAQRGDVAMLKLLIDRGADLDSSHKYGGNALGTAIYAAANFPTPGGDYPGAVDLLLDSGLERSDDMLTFASEHGLSGIAKKLIDRSDR